MQTAETVDTAPETTAEQVLEPAPDRAEATPTREAKEPARPAPHTDAPSTPAIGRIVHTHVPGSSYPTPAIITRVWGKECVNLRLQPDAGDRLTDAEISPTSVRRYEGELTRDGLPTVIQGRCWWWPPRV